MHLFLKSKSSKKSCTPKNRVTYRCMAQSKPNTYRKNPALIRNRTAELAVAGIAVRTSCLKTASTVTVSDQSCTTTRVATSTKMAVKR